MLLQILRRYVRGGHVIGRSLILADLSFHMRLEFLHAAVASGLVAALLTPRTRRDLIAMMHVQNASLLDALLAQGVALRELALDGDRYSLRGRRSRVLANAEGDAHAALLDEVMTYHNSVYTQLAERIRGAPPGDYIPSTGELVARSSRIGEPAGAAFLAHALRRVRPRAVLDVGCGSGVYLRQATRRSGVTAVGIDLSEEAASLAARNVHGWGLDDRIRIVCGDVRSSAQLGGPFDLVLLFQNLYYFEPHERPHLFARLRELTAPGGGLAILCAFAGRGRLASEIDIVLRSTRGNTPLPDLAATVKELRDAGYTVGRPKRMVPTEPLFGVLARAV
jgi:cyclopropane fatty-acyl-phospholipid synthase-like methyltransferase